jgi:hypothetical protein
MAVANSAQAKQDRDAKPDGPAKSGTFMNTSSFWTGIAEPAAETAVIVT